MSAAVLRLGDKGQAVKALQAARRLVNGGLNGLDRFTETYRVGDSLLPT